MPSSQPGSRALELLRLHPAPGSHRVALRAGASVGVPLLTCLALDRPQWTLYAAFGSFAALYGRDRVHAARAMTQVSAGVALTAAVLAGALVAELGTTPWTLVGGAAIIAVLGQLVSDVFDWHPPGPLFVTFAFGAVGSAPPLHDSLWVPVLVSSAAAGFSVAVGAVGAVVRRQHSPWPGVRRETSWHFVRLAVAVVVSGALAHLSGLGHPYWAMVAALATLAGRDHHARWLRGWLRALGTLLGLLPAALLLALHLDPVALVLTVIVLQFLTEILIGRNYGLALLFITPLALLMGQLAVERPIGQLLLDRGIETLIGAAVALVMVVIELRRPARHAS